MFACVAILNSNNSGKGTRKVDKEPINSLRRQNYRLVFRRVVSRERSYHKHTYSLINVFTDLEQQQDKG